MTQGQIQRADTSRITELDGLRGLYALIVVLFHLTHGYRTVFPDSPAPTPDFWWGKHGVEGFFAVSGFVILMTLDNTKRAGDFVVSRFSRLFPAYWTAMALTLIIVAASGLPQLQRDGLTILVNTTMLEMFLGFDYVDPSYWTLGVELAFYVLMLLIWRLRLIDRIEYPLALWLCIGWLSDWFPALEPVNTLFIGDYVPFFVLGIISYRIRTGVTQWRPQLPLFALASAAVFTRFAGEYQAGFVVAAGIMALLSAGRLDVFRHPVMMWLGAISYPLYLIHQFAGYAMMHTLIGLGLNPDLVFVLTLTTAIGAAYVIHVRVEKPVMLDIRQWWKRRALAQEASNAAIA